MASVMSSEVLHDFVTELQSSDNSSGVLSNIDRLTKVNDQSEPNPDCKDQLLDLVKLF